MTTPKPETELLPVTPEDREAYLAMNTLPEKYADVVRAGEWDSVTGMQVLARHRLAHTAPAAGEPALRWEGDMLMLGSLGVASVFKRQSYHWLRIIFRRGTLIRYPTLAEARTAAEQAVRDWLARAGLYAHPPASPTREVVELVGLLHQYRSDLKYPPAPDSRERRIAAIDAAIAKFGRDA